MESSVAERIKVQPNELEAFCRRWKVQQLALYGSILRDDFRPNSDIDALVTFASDAHWSLFEIVQMQREMKDIFGRDVDLAERPAVGRSRNYIRRRHILSTAQVVYES